MDSDIVATVTVADEPIVKDAWLKKGSFFSHVGSYQEEEEAVIFNTDKIVVDLWHEVLHRGTPLLARLYKDGRLKKIRSMPISARSSGAETGPVTQRGTHLLSPLWGSEARMWAWPV